MLFMHSYHLDTHNPLIALWFLIWYRAPDRGKRLFVLISLYVRLSGVSERDLPQLRRFNQDMGLTKNETALLFPATMAHWMWKKLLPMKQTQFYSDENREYYIERLVRRTPCWLWYADTNARRNDIRALLQWVSEPTLSS